MPEKETNNTSLLCEDSHSSRSNSPKNNHSSAVQPETSLVNSEGGFDTADEIVSGETLSATEKSKNEKEKIGEDIFAYYRGKRLVFITISLMLVLFVASLDIIITATIIEKVASRFGEYGKTGWLVTGYSLSTAVMVLLISKIAMALGAKFTLLACIIIFEIGSLISGLANSMNMLIAGRVIAGIGGAGIQNLVFIVISYIVEGKNRAIMQAFVGIAFSISSIAGPFLGGAFTTMKHQPNWRLCFYINLPIGGVAYILFSLLYNHKGSAFPYDIKKFDIKRLGQSSFYKKIFIGALFQFDMIEFILCTTGLVLFLIGLTYGGDGTYHWNSGTVISMLVVGGILIIVAFLWDCFVFEKFCTKYNQKAYPLINILVFQKVGMVAVNVTNFFMSVAFIMEMLFLIQYFQLVFGNSAWKAAVHLIATLVANTVSVLATGFFVKKTGRPKLVIVIACAVGTIGAGLLHLLTPNITASEKIGYLILPGVAFGGIVQTTLVASQVYADETKPDFVLQITSITSFYSFVKLIAMAFGSIIANVVFDVSLWNKIHKEDSLSYLRHLSINELIISRLQSFDGKDSSFAYAISSSIHNIFWLALGLSAISLFVSFFISNKRSAHA